MKLRFRDALHPKLFDLPDHPDSGEDTDSAQECVSQGQHSHLSTLNTINLIKI